MPFRFPFAVLKSNGVRVTRVALRDIRAGDRARGAADWPAAAAAYRRALRVMPELAHIWVQYAHAAKEAGDVSAAADAYSRAADLDPRDHEPHMFLGHLAKRGRAGRAARHYLDALRRAPDDLGAIGEVMQQLLASRREDEGFIDEALELLKIDRARVSPAGIEVSPADGTLFLDVTDLLSFFSFSRIPSGVQRVQIEMVLALLGAERSPLALCYYSPARRGWTTIAARTFRALCVASLRDEDVAGASWAAELRQVYVSSALSGQVTFPAAAVIVSLGANSPNANYLLHIRTESARSGVVYVAMMYDLIPILFPDRVVPAHARDFAAWMHSLLFTARGFIAISEATQRDVLEHARSEGQPFAASRSRVLRLDGDWLRRDRPPVDDTRLASWKLSRGGFVLFVSTIEPRKNHVGAFAAWLRLARELGERAIPDLVCVGGRGWLNDDVHAMLAREPILKRKVRLLRGIGDDDLDLLYRACSFTLYPSFYEGWGLPVTESLCHGKLPVISRTSSLPEAGGQFAIYLDPADVGSIVDAVRPLMVEPARVAEHEVAIRDGFRPRSWLEIGDELLREASAIAAAARNEGERIPVAPLARPVSLASADRIAVGVLDGETFRFGTGWGSPGERGCLIEGEDAALRFVLPPGGVAVRLDLRAGDDEVGYRIAAVAASRGRLAVGERRSVAIKLPARRVAEVAIAADGAGDLVVEGFEILPADAAA